MHLQQGNESRADRGDKENKFNTEVLDSSTVGEMKIQRKLSTAAGVLLILLLASGAQAGTVVFNRTDLQRGTDTGIFPFEVRIGGHFTEKLPHVEFLTSFAVQDVAILRGQEIVGLPLLGSGVFKFQARPRIFPTNLLGVAGGDWDLGLFRFWDPKRSRGKVSDEPLPAAAVLILVGLVALIALKGRRK